MGGGASVVSDSEGLVQPRRIESFVPLLGGCEPEPGMLAVPRIIGSASHGCRSRDRTQTSQDRARLGGDRTSRLVWPSHVLLPFPLFVCSRVPRLTRSVALGEHGVCRNGATDRGGRRRCDAVSTMVWRGDRFVIDFRAPRRNDPLVCHYARCSADVRMVAEGGRSRRRVADGYG